VSRRAEGRADLLLVCSTGGHLQQLLALADAWGGYSRVWVTFDKSDARSLLHDERVVFAHGPTNRSVKNLLRNLVVAWRTLREVRPRVVLTTGAGVAVPFAWLGRLHGARLVYVESFTRIDEPSLTCRLVAPVADRIYAQWPELVRTVPKARYAGTVFRQR
jgi:UDP-N-acetylglucosamine:LPS N-acetylglucosamine transferase